jgi:hypothetical protein
LVPLSLNVAALKKPSSYEHRSAPDHLIDRVGSQKIAYLDIQSSEGKVFLGSFDIKPTVLLATTTFPEGIPNGNRSVRTPSLSKAASSCEQTHDAFFKLVPSLQRRHAE